MGDIVWVVLCGWMGGWVGKMRVWVRQKNNVDVVRVVIYYSYPLRGLHRGNRSKMCGDHSIGHTRHPGVLML